ncbi:hypothetical protein [Hoeflea prorocentri]|uniref:Uncharacterized protein n=1 Tax=Hoeflea prorocentri TaxID=1922333 RepID=A0A9X3UQU6_9HYPH|nr:hypothetical protein [Hoeflea prorocentri]MCY6383689.1 hypothetical protein [Hoeflea prorocentri]MDA5401489.1 hypothetical protein [Hoeflea prorocentri]
MDNLAPLHAQAGRTRFAKSLNNAGAAAYVSLSFRMTNRVTVLSSRRTPFGLAPDGAGHKARRAVALAVLGTVFFSIVFARKKGSKLVELRKADRLSPLLRRARAAPAHRRCAVRRVSEKTIVSDIIYHRHGRGPVAQVVRAHA